MSKARIPAAIGRRREVSEKTRTEYGSVLQQCVTDLIDCNLPITNLTDLNQKHVIALVRLFLMADAVACAKAGQKVPEGYYNVQLMLGKVLRKGEVGLCGTCMDARGLRDEDLMEGAKRSTLAQLADWTVEADKVLVF